MSQDTFNCFWRTFILPYFLANNYSVANKPDREEISDAEIEALLSFLYNQPHNLDNFHDWLHQVRNDRNHQLGARSWIKKIQFGAKTARLVQHTVVDIWRISGAGFRWIIFSGYDLSHLVRYIVNDEVFFLIQN